MRLIGFSDNRAELYVIPARCRVFPNVSGKFQEGLEIIITQEYTI